MATQVWRRNWLRETLQQSKMAMVKSAIDPLIMTNIANWKIKIFNGKTHYEWPFSIVILVYQRVYLHLSNDIYRCIVDSGYLEMHF